MSFHLRASPRVREDEPAQQHRSEFPDFQETFAHQAQEQDEDASVERTEQTPPRKVQEKEPKRMKKDGSALEGVIGRYLDVKTKQAQEEAELLAKEKEAAQANDYSIKRCISLLKIMDVTRDEKGDADGALDRLWQHKKAEIKQ